MDASAPAATRALTQGRWPLSAAQWSGVLPLAFWWLTSGGGDDDGALLKFSRSESRYSTTWTLPLAAGQCRRHDCEPSPSWSTSIAPASTAAGVDAWLSPACTIAHCSMA